MIFKEGLISYLSRLYATTPDIALAFLVIGFILIAAAGYFLGSINSAIILSRLFHKEDIRSFGSGNAGMTNMLRTYGGRDAALTFVGDVLKSLVAIAFGYFMMKGNGVYIAGTFCVIGHVYPAYYHFKGGKGVLCFATMACVINPVAFLITLGIFVLIVLVTRFVSLGSVVGSLAYVLILSRMANDGWSVIFCMTAALLVAICHAPNLKRIMNRKENRLTFKRKKKDDSHDGTDRKN